MSSIIPDTRRYDIDWLRVILFILLIWFHYAVFSLGQLEGKDSNMNMFNIPLFIVIAVMHQWRLAALFVISGMGTAFAFRHRTWQTYVMERGSRLGIPLLFSIFILFFGIFNPIYSLVGLFTIFPGADNMPYGHLWFIYNLLIYSIILSPLFAHVRNNPEGSLVNFIRSILSIRHGLGILLLPPIVLAINGILFKPWAFGEVGMWWEFPRYLLYFLFGYLLISAKEEYFDAIDKLRITVTIVTPIFAIIWFTLQESSDIPDVMDGGWVDYGFPAFSIGATFAALIQSLHAWFWCLLIFSWASKLLNKPNKYLGYLNEAVYPTYIVHLHITFLPIAIFGLLGIGYYINLVIGSILVLVSVLVCFEIARRATYFRVVFGIKGGKEKVKKIYPYNKIQNRNSQIAFAILCHIMTVMMIIGLMMMMIFAEILSEF